MASLQREISESLKSLDDAIRELTEKLAQVTALKLQVGWYLICENLGSGPHSISNMRKKEIREEFQMLVIILKFSS